MVNGRADWDGGAVTTRSFIQSQTALLDQWHSPSSGTEGETKERMREPSLEKEVDARTNMDKEQQVAVPCEETDTETLKTSEMQHDKVEVLEPEDVSTEQQGEQNTEAVSPEEALRLHFKCLQTDDGIQSGRKAMTPAEESTQDTTCSAEKEIQRQSSAELVTRAEDGTQATTCSADVQIQSWEGSASPAEKSTLEPPCCLQREIQIPSVEESATPSESVDTVNECWDEYFALSAVEGHVGENSSELVFTSLLSDTQTQLPFTEQQTSWHFPAGPGLAEEVQCPLLEFPTMSYYPPPEPTVPFEGGSQTVLPNSFSFVFSHN